MMIGIGVLIAIVTTFIDYRTIVQAAPVIYGLGLVLLALVLSPLGKEVKGNKSWLDLGFIGLQPSEFAKLFTILLLTYYLAQVRRLPLDVRTLVNAGLIWIVPTVLVYLQNDTGSTLSFISILIAMVFLSGVRWTWLAAGAAAVVLVGLACHSPNKRYEGIQGRTDQGCLLA